MVVIFTKAYACAGRIIEIFEMKASIVNTVKVEDNPKIIERESQLEKIMVEFKNVSMYYKKDKMISSNSMINNNIKLAETSTYDIEHITFQVKHGETRGIIGGTGYYISVTTWRYCRTG